MIHQGWGGVGGEGGGGGAASLGDAADPGPALKKQVMVDSCDPCPCFSLPPPTFYRSLRVMNDGSVGSFQESRNLHVLLGEPKHFGG